MTHSKNVTPLLYLLIICILSAKSATKMLSLKEEYSLRFKNF